MQKIPNRIQALKTLYFANIDFAFATTFLNSFSKTLIVSLVTFFHGSELLVNMTFAIPSLIGLMQIPGALLGKRLLSYKPFVFYGQGLWRLIHLPIIFLPFLRISSSLKLAILFLCISIGAIGWHMSMPILNEWLAEMVPKRNRGWFFSRRNAVAAAVAALVGVLGGFTLDSFKRLGEEATGYGLVFGLIFFIALLSLFCFKGMTDMPRSHVETGPLVKNLKELSIPLKDKNFRNILLYGAALMAGLMLGGNLYYSYMLKELKLSFAIIQTTVITEAIGYILAAPLWGHLSDKYGNKPVLAMVGFLLFLSPIMWQFTHPGHDPWNAIILISGYTLGGIAWSGALMCYLNLIMASSPIQHRVGYIGIGLALQALMGALAPMLSGWGIGMMTHSFAPEIAYKITFAAVALIRLASLTLINRFYEEGSKSIAQTLKQISSVSPKGYQAFKKLSKNYTTEGRSEAIQKLGTAKLTLATKEIIQALNDPSPQIRRQAAITLGTLGDTEATGALLNMIEENPEIVNNETLKSLGKLKNPKAIPALLKFLDHPRFILRYAAINALGKIEHFSAAMPLCSAYKRYESPDLKAGVIVALRKIKANNAEDLITQALLDKDPGVRIAAAEAVIEFKFISSLNNLRASIQTFQDGATSEVAYALGRLGAKKDIPEILKLAAGYHGENVFRQRCLLGVAAILGIEYEVYPLLQLKDMELEHALLAKVNKIHAKPKYLQEALSAFFAGKEFIALQILKQNEEREPFTTFAELSCPQLFLVAICAIQ